jgi:hypothetical protein
MKNNKNLLTEILRVQELMGVKQLISEEGGKYEPVVDFFKSILKISVKDIKFTKMFDEAFEHIKYKNSELFEKLKKSLDTSEISVNGLQGLRHISSLKSSELKAMLEELQSEMISYIFTKYTDDFIEIGDDIIEASLVGKPQAKSVYDFMVDLAQKGEAEQLQIAIKKQRGNFPSYVLDHIQNTKFIQKAGDSTLDAIEEIGDALIDGTIAAGDATLGTVKKVFGEAWAKIVYGWDKIGDWTLLIRKYSGLNGPLEGMLTAWPIKQIANAPGLSYLAKKMHLSYDKIMVGPHQIKKDLDDILTRIINKLDKGESTGILEEQKELTAKMAQFLSKRDESHKIIFDEWMILWKEDPRLKRLFSPTQKRPKGEMVDGKFVPEMVEGKPTFYEVPEPFYFKSGWGDPKFKQMMEAFENASGDNVAAIKQTYNKVEGSVKLLLNILKLLPHRSPFVLKNYLNYGRNMLELVQRLLGTVLVYTPNTWKELSHNMRVMGRGRMIGVGIGQKIVTSVVYIPALLSAYRTIGSVIQDYVNSKRMAKAEPNKPLPEKMKWWLLNDDEWSKLTSGEDGDVFKATLSFLADSYYKFSLANMKELENEVLPWSLTGWAYLENFSGDWKVSDFFNQFSTVEAQSQVTLDGVHNESKTNPEVKKVVTDNKIPTYKELGNKIDTTLKTRPKLVPQEEANY